MNIAQLEYIIALDYYKSFSVAAEKCFVTQPTLSTQVKKLEEELGVVLFDRSSQPLALTSVGNGVIDRARKIVSEISVIGDIVKDSKNVISGELHLAVIPTLAPYLVPYFLGDFLRKYPSVKLKITEEKTDHIVHGILRNEFDAGIAATPVKQPGIQEIPLFYEKLLCYMNADISQNHKHRVKIEEILESKIWVLAEGNCIRNQTFNLCGMAQLEFRDLAVDYQSGSIETLMKLADKEGGSTIIPELSSLDLEDSKLDQVKFIGEENPVREISMLIQKKGYKSKLFDVLIETVKSNLPEQLKENVGDMIVPL